MARATAYIAIGSNLGDRAETLRAAVAAMNATDGIAVTRQSSLIETHPVGGPADQPAYLNGAVAVETTLTPHELLGQLQRIESALGRDRSAETRWGPRPCDLDIVLMDDVVVDTPDLTIPHPRLAERAFVLAPLAQIAPDARHPIRNKTIAELLVALESGE
ncbi:hypothetical protein LCGC14_0205290 [marine sediment metagenome]|uniref:2-amino-4-hydroxy-6-hydroxymethyldihydropteridine diphosphokinase n=1 Tax=marine sediment metagenome TaxID=412755 RepID=A0A0F9X1Y8_9ZZZZ|nr:2-amino-4-hydroxy-6-hydroxymethyldihydropteridine diphosphokinase [Phycisphaerae bacterium]HDZ44735.1 2-amino-4-hydroxy-6-hydroxymethyldihydropteridine diphosphokinase [Phycisphaerae bacterium]